MKILSHFCDRDPETFEPIWGQVRIRAVKGEPLSPEALGRRLADYAPSRVNNPGAALIFEHEADDRGEIVLIEPDNAAVLLSSAGRGLAFKPTYRQEDIRAAMDALRALLD